MPIRMSFQLIVTKKNVAFHLEATQKLKMYQLHHLLIYPIFPHHQKKLLKLIFILKN